MQKWIAEENGHWNMWVQIVPARHFKKHDDEKQTLEAFNEYQLIFFECFTLDLVWNCIFNKTLMARGPGGLFTLPT